MEILYHIGKSRFMVLDGGNEYIVSLTKNEVTLLDDISFESILRQGYWQYAENIDEDIKEACFSLIEEKGFKAFDTKELILDISNCDQIWKAREDKNHPCHTIVQYQYLEKPEKQFQHPEPWNGYIDRAEILFVGSNPSIDFDEIYPDDNWSDNDISDFHNNRFSVENDYYQKNKNKVKFWQCMRKIASWLLEKSLSDDSLDDSICSTEIVHCKSKKEKGVPEACQKCSDKWMIRILSCFKGTYIVVLGKTAEPRFKRIVSNNNEYFKYKKIIYAPHPSRWCYIGTDINIKNLIMNQIK